MKKFLLLLLLSISANAADVNISWENATLLADGVTPIPVSGAESLDTTTVEWAACINGQLSDPRLSNTIDASIQTLDVTIGTPGEWCFTSYHTNVAGIDSAEAPVIQRTVLAQPPQPPQNMTVTGADLLAYNLVKQPDGLLLVPVGTVAIGTECDTSQSWGGKYIVPTSAVTWSGNIEPVVVVATCA
jgi:hypothetical protein